MSGRRREGGGRKGGRGGERKGENSVGEVGMSRRCRSAVSVCCDIVFVSISSPVLCRCYCCCVWFKLCVYRFGAFVDGMLVIWYTGS